MTPSTPAMPDKGKKPVGEDEGAAQGAAPATIVVTLPADAKLMIDDSPTTSTSGRRVFVSPALTPGRTFHYTLKAEVVRAGKPVRTEKRVEVSAGKETEVSLTMPPTGVVQR